MTNNLVFVTYDSILNSVFSGQVIEPLIKKKQQNSTLNIYVISFEKSFIDEEVIKKLIPKSIHFIQYRRLPVLGKWSLYSSIFFLKKFLRTFASYTLIARGPLAGFVGLKAIDKGCITFIMQARGLLAEEYEVTHSQTTQFLKNKWHAWRKKKLFELEFAAFNPEKKPANFSIEAVSTALKTYLIEIFKVQKQFISIASHDIPSIIPASRRMQWRSIIRKKLGLYETTYVYCYNGAIKAWQCPTMVAQFFVQQLAQQKNIFLLVLTQDVKLFEQLLLNQGIDRAYFYVTEVPHHEIYAYLSACDTGLIFRKEHIVSWVSRPVKAMEYYSAGLTIIHNNTVKWLIDQDYGKEFK